MQLAIRRQVVGWDGGGMQWVMPSSQAVSQRKSHMDHRPYGQGDVYKQSYAHLALFTSHMNPMTSEILSSCIQGWKSAHQKNRPDNICSFVCVKTHTVKLTANVLQMIVGMPVPHQTTADGAQYAVSAKATTKDDHVNNNDVNKQQEDQEVCILRMYIWYTYVTIGDWSSITKDIPIHNSFIQNIH